MLNWGPVKREEGTWVLEYFPSQSFSVFHWVVYFEKNAGIFVEIVIDDNLDNLNVGKAKSNRW